jgi:hypothetical protein
MGWGAALDILLKILPIQGRIERWKNELESLTKEKEKLLKGKWDEKKGNRLMWIDNRIGVLNQLLRNR